jgi:hypothetical protein
VTPPSQLPKEAAPSKEQPTTPTQPETTQPQAESSNFDFGSGLAGGAGTVAVNAPGYMDCAIPETNFRFRFDSAYRDNRPDRAEFFYPKCGCFGTPDAKGPPLPETKVDYQDLSSYLELAFDRRFSGFIEVPVRFLNPEVNADHTGIGDMNVGVKAALIADPCEYLTFQFRTYIPTGDGREGLGTEHVSLEPALLFHQQLTNQLAFDSEVRDWIPIDGSDFAGNVIRYGFGFSYEVYRSCMVRVAPISELVGWTVLSGKEFSPNLPGTGVKDASGDTIVNAKLGARVHIGDTSEVYFGYGRALTGTVWYKDIFRVEYKLDF